MSGLDIKAALQAASCHLHGVHAASMAHAASPTLRPGLLCSASVRPRHRAACSGPAGGECHADPAGGGPWQLHASAAARSGSGSAGAAVHPGSCRQRHQLGPRHLGAPCCPVYLGLRVWGLALCTQCWPVWGMLAAEALGDALQAVSVPSLAGGWVQPCKAVGDGAGESCDRPGHTAGSRLLDTASRHLPVQLSTCCKAAMHAQAAACTDERALLLLSAVLTASSVDRRTLLSLTPQACMFLICRCGMHETVPAHAGWPTASAAEWSKAEHCSRPQH